MRVENKADYWHFIDKCMGNIEEFAEFVTKLKIPEEDENFVRETAGTKTFTPGYLRTME